MLPISVYRSAASTLDFHPFTRSIGHPTFDRHDCPHRCPGRHRAVDLPLVQLIHPTSSTKNQISFTLPALHLRSIVRVRSVVLAFAVVFVFILVLVFRSVIVSVNVINPETLPCGGSQLICDRGLMGQERRQDFLSVKIEMRRAGRQQRNSAGDEYLREHFGGLPERRISQVSRLGHSERQQRRMYHRAEDDLAQHNSMKPSVRIVSSS